MTLFREIVAELLGMFVADLGLTATIVAIVLAAALLPSTGGGLVLLLGCPATLVVSVRRKAARKSRRR